MNIYLAGILVVSEVKSQWQQPLGAWIRYNRVRDAVDTSSDDRYSLHKWSKLLRCCEDAQSRICDALHGRRPAASPKENTDHTDSSSFFLSVRRDP